MIHKAPKIAAILYLLWGVIHIAGGAVMLNASSTGADAFLQLLTGNASAGLIATSSAQTGPGLLATSKVFAFHSFNLIWLGLLASVIAVRLNWKNSSFGHWLNLAIVGFADLGLILFMVLPGVIRLSDAWIGPALLIPAFAFSTLGRFQQAPA